jgi:hypothetical protein
MERGRKRRLIGAVIGSAAAVLLGAGALLGMRAPDLTGTHLVVGYNDLGMHCMQSDFSQMMILPPYNTLHAQVIRRGAEPEIVEGGDATVRYELPTNTHSSDKCNFWTFAPQLLGAAVPPDMGVAGFGMTGQMAYKADRRDFEATGIPVTPVEDDGRENPYPLALITVRNDAGTVIAQTQAVVPVSWEMSCNLCHNTPGESTATTILKDHDRLHGSDLMNQQPVTCAACHSDNALGAPGLPGVSSLSAAMHTAHGPRMGQVNMANDCYACHPGVRTDCLRDVHAQRGMTCTDCHGSMAAVGSPTRRPWLDQPSCGGCHQRPGFEFEQPGQLFRNSVGHKGVQCMTCHGSPHAVGPARTAADNAQAVRLQGHSGVINDCTVCHINTPGRPFFHKIDD